MIDIFSSKNKLLIKIFILFIAIFILFLFPQTNKKINTGIENFFYHLKGEGEPDSNIIIINITSNDIEAIGPWPIKRSYYALLINNLKKQNVKAIGLEVFLSARFVTQTIYDNLLLREIEKAGNVVLSSVAGNINKKNDKFFTDSLSYPSPKLLNENLPSGHLNYIHNERIIIPSVVEFNGVKEKAFSFQLRSLRRPDKYLIENYIINFTSGWEKFQRYSLLEYFEMVENSDEKLKDFENRIIIVGVTDNQIASSVETPFDDNLPGAALHAFALDNLLNKNFLNDIFFNSSQYIFPLILLFFILFEPKKIRIILYYLFITFLFLLAAYYLFTGFNLILSYLSFLFPSVILLLADIYFYSTEKKYKIQNETEALKTLLRKKEDQLRILEDKIKADYSTSLTDQIEILKSEIERLKENEDDKLAAELKISDEVKNFYGIVYKSKIMSQVVGMIKKTAPEDATVLITGESGTGKELAARAFHHLSKRSGGNFVAVNCGALSENLLESELFGHVKGAFTGAFSDKTGRFEAADKGTIFLDEIAETSEAFQVKLLRVLQSGDFEKVGSNKTFHTDARIIAATNKNLEQLIREKKFREDLYYRLNVIKIELPPLRERKEDIEAIADYFLKRENDKINFSKTALDAIKNYQWKGNVRELEAVIKRAVILSKAEARALIQVRDLPDEVIKNFKYDFEDIVIDSLREKRFSHSSVVETARELSVSRTLVSENLRGFSFKVLIENNFDFNKSAEIISGSQNDEVIQRLKSKIETFINNIENDLRKNQDKNFEEIKMEFKSKYKNLPLRYHQYLDEVIKYLMK